MSFALLLLLPSVSAISANCQELLVAGSPEAATAAVSLEYVEVADEYFPLRCVPALISKGYWEAASTLISKMGDKQLTQKEALRRQAVDAKKKVEKFISSLEPKTKEQMCDLDRVTPAMQWAQSPTKIFLDVKFAHRFDSPGCLEVKDPKVTFLDTHLKFTGTCIMSGQKLKYVLDMELQDTINPKTSYYSFASVGRLTITLEKKTPSVWSSPVKGKKPNNMQIWWEMKERYRKEMRSLAPDEGEV